MPSSLVGRAPTRLQLAARQCKQCRGKSQVLRVLPRVFVTDIHGLQGIMQRGNEIMIVCTWQGDTAHYSFNDRVHAGTHELVCKALLNVATF